MAKSNKATASTWRKLDAAYRKQEKARRDANAAKRKAREDADQDV